MTFAVENEIYISRDGCEVAVGVKRCEFDQKSVGLGIGVPVGEASTDGEADDFWRRAAFWMLCAKRLRLRFREIGRGFVEFQFRRILLFDPGDLGFGDFAFCRQAAVGSERGTAFR